MATNYPNALDDNITLPDTKVDSTITGSGDHANHHNNLADAVRAVQTALGTNPKGPYSSVAAALLGKVDTAPTADQVVQGTGDIVGLAIKAAAAQNLKNVFEMRLSNNAIGAYIDLNGAFSAQVLKIAGTLLASTHLSDSAALARLASPAFTGTPTAPTPTAGDNSTKIATTAFVAGAAPAAGTSGTLATIPSVSANAGRFYYATDQAVLFFSDGTNWIRQGVPAGTTVEWFQPSGTIPTGWVAYDGGVLPSSTGIYADLYTHLGGTTSKPDTRGRVVVGQGTHADVATIGGNDGISTVANRRVKHKHTIVRSVDVALNDPGHAHNYNNIVGGGNNIGAGTSFQGLTNATSSSGTGISVSQQPNFTVGPQTGAEPTDSSAYIVGLRIAKL